MNNLLPIGSVVKLQSNENFIMIHGRFYSSKNTLYDYVGCIYPQGVISNKNLIAFNQSDIEDIFYMGYKSNLELKCRKEILEFLNREGDLN